MLNKFYQITFVVILLQFFPQHIFALDNSTHESGAATKTSRPINGEQIVMQESQEKLAKLLLTALMFDSKYKELVQKVGPINLEFINKEEGSGATLELYLANSSMTLGLGSMVAGIISSFAGPSDDEAEVIVSGMGTGLIMLGITSDVFSVQERARKAGTQVTEFEKTFVRDNLRKELSVIGDKYAKLLDWNSKQKEKFLSALENEIMQSITFDRLKLNKTFIGAKPVGKLDNIDLVKMMKFTLSDGAPLINERQAEAINLLKTLAAETEKQRLSNLSSKAPQLTSEQKQLVKIQVKEKQIDLEQFSVLSKVFEKLEQHPSIQESAEAVAEAKKIKEAAIAAKEELQRLDNLYRTLSN